MAKACDTFNEMRSDYGLRRKVGTRCCKSVAQEDNMNFTAALSSDDEGQDANELTHRRVSENGLVEIGVYRVLYGYRVRAGFAGYMCCHLDWCGGANWNDVQVLYSYAVAILSQMPEDRGCFDTVPARSAVKPFFRDANFCAALKVLCEKPELLLLEMKQ